MSEQIKQVEEVINKLENKDVGLYFFTLDTRGNPVAGIANIYQHVKVLNELGYKAHILHEKNDYKLKGDADGMGLEDWLGSEYAELPHISIESQELNVGPADMIFIPEVFANVMEQVKDFPCKKVVFCQSHEFILELLQPGARWGNYGFTDVITTSDKQGDYVRVLFPTIKTHTVPVAIPDYFCEGDKPKQPIVTIVGRNQVDVAKVTKQFYLQFPMYRFVTFEELRGLPRKVFADRLKNSCLAVWIDDVAGFGTFPLEAIECNTPVIGKIPNTIPEWMEKSSENGISELENHGVWTNTTTNIPELIATYMKVWLEDTVPSDLLEKMEATRGSYTEEKQRTKIEEVYNTLIEDRIEGLKETLTKLQEQEKANAESEEVKE